MNAGKEKINGFLETRSHRLIDFADPDHNSYDINDIAYALSNICRFNGCTDPFYSVAQHSLWVAGRLQQDGYHRRLVLGGLLHDAAEAYVGDNVSPLKDAVPELRQLEDRILAAILASLAVSAEYGCGLSAHEDSIIKAYDRLAVCVEGRILMRSRQPVYDQCDLGDNDYRELFRLVQLRTDGGDAAVRAAFCDMYYELQGKG